MGAKDEAEAAAAIAPSTPTEVPVTSQVVSAQKQTSSSPTSPAPPNVMPETTTDVPSARPTSAPDYEGMALARGVLSFERTNVSHSIPKRAKNADTSVLSHDAAFVFMHVDGVSTVATIATVADRPLDEVVMCFLELTALGVVTMEAKPLDSLPPESHVNRRR